MTGVETWVHPELLLLLLPVTWFAFVRGRQRSSRSQARVQAFAGPRAAHLPGALSTRWRKARRLLLAGTLSALIVAAARPRFGEAPDELAPRGLDLVVVLDVSRSMLAIDPQPSRLRAAKDEIAALLQRARGERFALVAFAGEARAIMPLTTDIAAVARRLAETDPLSVARGGTDVGAALQTALALLGDADGRHELILLLTDGEDHEGRGLAAAARAAEQGIRIHALGVGGTEGARVPERLDGRGGWIRRPDGQPVLSRPDAVSLRAIAERSGGRFLRLDTPRQGRLVELYEDDLLPMQRKAFEAERLAARPERFHWALIPGLALWAFILMVPERRRR